MRKVSEVISREAGGDNTPDYRSRKKGLPMNAYYAKLKASHTNWVAIADRCNFSNFNVYYDTPSHIVSEADNRATRKFYDAAAAKDFDLGVFTAEAPKSFELLANTIIRVRNLNRGIRRGSLVEVAEALGFYPRHGRKELARQRNGRRGNPSRRQVRYLDQSASSLFLEYKYGWTPLYNDVYNSFELLSKEWASKDADIVVRGTGSYESLWSSGPIDYIDESRVRYTCYYRVVNPLTRNLASIGLTNPSAIVWETIPFSFVFDWFVPVGQWINAQSALHGLTFIKGCKSQETYHEGVVREEDWGCHKGISIQPGPMEVYNLQRSVLSTSPATLPILNPQKVEKAFKWDRALAALSLISVRF